MTISMQKCTRRKAAEEDIGGWEYLKT